MNNRIQFQVKIFFLAAFAVICAGMWGYQLYYVKPARECEAAGKWWYKPSRECVHPVKITDLTGRHMDEPDKTLPPPAQPQWRPPNREAETQAPAPALSN